VLEVLLSELEHPVKIQVKTKPIKRKILVVCFFISHKVDIRPAVIELPIALWTLGAVPALE
jgi:Kef-type K+ transport system membrane component KefB